MELAQLRTVVVDRKGFPAAAGWALAHAGLSGVWAISMMTAPRVGGMALRAVLFLVATTAIAAGGRLAAADRRRVLRAPIGPSTLTMDAAAWVAAFMASAAVGVAVATAQPPASDILQSPQGPPTGWYGYGAFVVSMGLLSGSVTTLRLKRDGVRISAIGVLFAAVAWTGAWLLASIVSLFGLAYAGALTNRLGATGGSPTNLAEPVAIVLLNVVVGALGGILAGGVAEAALRAGRE